MTNDMMASALQKAGVITAAQERKVVRAQSRKLEEQSAQMAREREKQDVKDADFDAALKQAFGGRR
jgi:hypothetical protein